jgi:hypothetical protein
MSGGFRRGGRALPETAQHSAGPLGRRFRNRREYSSHEDAKRLQSVSLQTSVYNRPGISDEAESCELKAESAVLSAISPFKAWGEVVLVDSATFKDSFGLILADGVTAYERSRPST